MPTNEAILELFHERAAIMEYDANMPRSIAEKEATKDVCKNVGSYARVVIEDWLKAKKKTA